MKKAVIFLISFACFSALFVAGNYFFSYRQNLSQKATDANIVSSSVRSGYPVRLRIPSIGVNALIEPLGLTKTGAMDAPKGPANAGWYEPGPRPGEPGSAVIDGHRGWKDNIPAVFDNLHKIKIGDTVYVEDGKGGSLTFVVRDMRTYKATDYVPEIWTRTGGTYLNLITCAGDFNGVTHTSNDRLVVFTELAS